MEFLNIEINEKRFVRILIVSIVLVVMYLAFTMSSLLIFKSYKLGPNTSIAKYEDMDMHIDLLEHDNKKIEISGWAYKKGEPLGTVNSNYVLKHQETGNMYLMRTQMEENINITDEEYKMSGMHAQCLLFGIPKGMYDIYVLYQNNGEDLLAFTLISVEL